MKKQPVKKRNASDITLRDLTGRIDKVEEDQAFLRESSRQTFRELEARVDAIERRQEAASRQPERVERDNIEGGQGITPLPSTASTPETRREP
jgi:hypothetical protein